MLSDSRVYAKKISSDYTVGLTAAANALPASPCPHERTRAGLSLLDYMGCPAGLTTTVLETVLELQFAAEHLVVAQRFG